MKDSQTQSLSVRPRTTSSDLKRLKQNPHNQSAQADAKSIEQFFRSDWYSCLTDVNGEQLIRKSNLPT